MCVFPALTCVFLLYFGGIALGRSAYNVTSVPAPGLGLAVLPTVPLPQPTNDVEVLFSITGLVPQASYTLHVWAVSQGTLAVVCHHGSVREPAPTGFRTLMHLVELDLAPYPPCFAALTSSGAYVTCAGAQVASDQRCASGGARCCAGPDIVRRPHSPLLFSHQSHRQLGVWCVTVTLQLCSCREGFLLGWHR